jgi:para-nitrobenzyl esterase
LIRDSLVLPNPAAAQTMTPVLTGLNADEASVDPGWNAPDAAALQSVFKSRFADQAPCFAALYSTGAAADARVTVQTMLRDRGVAAMLLWAQARVSGSPPVYAYLFGHVEPGTDATRFGVFHSAEIPYVFDMLIPAWRPFTAQDRQLAATVGAYWANFVKTGNPNGPGLKVWPDLSRGELMELGDRVGPRAALSPDKLASYRAYAGAGGALGIF